MLNSRYEAHDFGLNVLISLGFHSDKFVWDGMLMF